MENTEMTVAANLVEAYKELKELSETNAVAANFIEALAEYANACLSYDVSNMADAMESGDVEALANAIELED
jgi:hypothetical protein